MPLYLGDFESGARCAVRLFWENRDAAIQKQKISGQVDQGGRSGVTAGKNMDGFVALIVDIVKGNGLSDAQIHLQRRVLTLPGFFRPAKLWDILVINRGQLIAALELKSQVGPSFGNNFNNRTEEAIGTAYDLWTAFREGAFGQSSSRPFVGWLMMVEDCLESRSPIRDSSPHFPVFAEFQGASYLDRYDILCRKLIQEQMYTVASIIASDRTNGLTGEYREFSENTSLKAFVTALAGHVATEAARA